MKKDDIEKLISSLEDFSKTPPDGLWKGIEEQLDEPKKKKGLLFWWSLAACLVVGLGLMATFYLNSNSGNSLLNVPVENENGLVNQSKAMDSVAEEVVKNKIRTDKKAIDSRLSNSNDEIQTKNQNTSTKSTVLNSNSISKKEVVAVISTNKTTVLVDENKNYGESRALKNTEKEAFAKDNSIAEQQKNTAEKTSLDNKIKENSSTTDLKENALAAIEKEQQKKDKKVVLEDKWSMQVFAGVNSSQNLKNQKSLGNTIESQRGHSYGVKTNYKLNRRWALSTGLKISELGQQVANVSYINSAKSLVNVSLALTAVPQEKSSITTNSNYLFIANDNSERNAVASTFYEKGNLSQKVQYLEMPMEVSYTVLNKGKARINMNTGGFVGKAISNDVLLNDTSIGKNQDVNDVVFGTVLSSTLQYEVFKKTKVFVEPGMNYYTQPVQNQNFNQFQLIFNFGLNVSF